MRTWFVVNKSTFSTTTTTTTTTTVRSRNSSYVDNLRINNLSSTLRRLSFNRNWDSSDNDFSLYNWYRYWNRVRNSVSSYIRVLNVIYLSLMVVVLNYWLSSVNASWNVYILSSYRTSSSYWFNNSLSGNVLVSFSLKINLNVFSLDSRLNISGVIDLSSRSLNSLAS